MRAATPGRNTPPTETGRETPSTPVDPSPTSGGVPPGEVDKVSPGSALERSDWPPNRGFLGDPVETVLRPGTRIDRFGEPRGTFVSPEKTLFSARSLRSTSINAPYHVYEVVQPITVQGGTVAPAFGYGGGGIQYEFRQPIADLLKSGVLKEIPSP